MYPAIAKHGVQAALAAGAAWFILGVLSIVTPDPERYLDVLMFAPLILSIGAIIGVHELQRQRAGTLERIAFLAFAIGLGFIIVGQIAVIADSSTVQVILLVPGFLLWVGGAILYSIATFRAGVLPRWWGVLIALAEPLTIVFPAVFIPDAISDSGDYSGAVVQGVIRLAIGTSMRSVLRRGADRRSVDPSPNMAGERA